MPNCFVAPLVGILQPRLKEVEARSKSCQDQDRHKQVEGNKPVQKQPRHAVRAAESPGVLAVGRAGSQSSHPSICRPSTSSPHPLLHWRSQKGITGALRELHAASSSSSSCSDVQRRGGVAMTTTSISHPNEDAKLKLTVKKMVRHLH